MQRELSCAFSFAPQAVLFAFGLMNKTSVDLRLGRKDDCAMKVYQAALRSNLTTPIREEINMLVAQHYLHEEKLADELIPVLEGALKTARRALNQYAEAK